MTRHTAELGEAMVEAEPERSGARHSGRFSHGTGPQSTDGTEHRRAERGGLRWKLNRDRAELDVQVGFPIDSMDSWPEAIKSTSHSLGMGHLR